jgi:1,4-dihydroxy-2-naphthoyl-CoA synthase
MDVMSLISWVTSNSRHYKLAQFLIRTTVSPTSVCSSSLGVDNSLRDTLAIEMGQQINQVEVLEQERAILANSLVRLWVLNGAAIGGGVDWLLVVLEGRCWFVVCHHDCCW